MANENYIFGYHAVVSALKTFSKAVKCVYLQSKQQDKRAQEVIDLANYNKVPVKHLSRDQLNKIDQKANHQGVMADVKYPGNYNESHINLILERHKDKAIFVILDGVQDPHNLGACLRTANAAGAHAVIVPKDKACGITPTVYKVASGAVGITPVIQVTNLCRTIQFLKKSGVWVYGTDEDGSQTIYQSKLNPPLALVFGGEGKGLRRLTKESCDLVFKIPMKGVVSNLNVSVALGVCLFELVRQESLI